MTNPQRECFPPIDAALDDPNGLLAVGGDLSAERLLAAYRHGIFPWSEDSQPVLWWSPNPRAVIAPAEVKVSRSLRRSMRRHDYPLSINTAFAQVIHACAGSRAGENGTWITDQMIAAYTRLHQLGYAHSLEVWHHDELVGGLYGVAVGKLFCGESMFYQRSDASKIAFVALCQLLAKSAWPLIDCQILNPHLESLGVGTITREQFKTYLPAYLSAKSPANSAELGDRLLQRGATPNWRSLPFASSAELERSFS